MRSGELLAPPPPGLPTFTGQPDLLPLGKASEDGRERLVGVPLADTFFAYIAGRTRYGKTESAIGQFVHLALNGHGCFFLDPHTDALEKIQPHLTSVELRERVVEIDLADSRPANAGLESLRTTPRRDAARHPPSGSMRSSTPSPRRCAGTSRNTRALNLITQASQALCELAPHLPDDLAPTMFQIPTLLGNEMWRAVVLKFVSPPTRAFFVERFPRLASEAITPITNMVDRLRVSPEVAALLGSPTSSYDVRAAMDEGMIVLACPGSGIGARPAGRQLPRLRPAARGEESRLDATRGAPSLLRLPRRGADLRRRLLREPRGAVGAERQVRRAGGRCFNQNPERLTRQTLNAITTNRSHLLSTALGAKSARLLARELSGKVEPQTISDLPRYSVCASVTLDGEVSPPFLLRGVPVEELAEHFPEPRMREEVDALEVEIDRRMVRRPPAETVARIDGHDKAIIAHLRARASYKKRSRGAGRGVGKHTPRRPEPSGDSPEGR